MLTTLQSSTHFLMGGLRPNRAGTIRLSAYGPSCPPGFHAAGGIATCWLCRPTMVDCPKIFWRLAAADMRCQITDWQTHTVHPVSMERLRSPEAPQIPSLEELWSARGPWIGSIFVTDIEIIRSSGIRVEAPDHDAQIAQRRERNAAMARQLDVMLRGLTDTIGEETRLECQRARLTEWKKQEGNTHG